MALDWGNIGAGAAAGAGMGTAINPGWGTAIGGVVGALGGLLSGGKKNSDPLAGIRAQLQAIATRQQALADQIPGMVDKQKGIIKDVYGNYKTQGTQAIGENIHADRGFGNTSLEDRLRNELFDKLARGQAQDELAAEQWGLKTQGDIYGTTANTYGDIANLTPPNAPSPWPGVLSTGAQFIGNYLGNQQLGDILNPAKTTNGPDYSSLFLPSTFSEDVKSNFRPSSSYFGGNQHA